MCKELPQLWEINLELINKLAKQNLHAIYFFQSLILAYCITFNIIYLFFFSFSQADFNNIGMSGGMSLLSNEQNNDAIAQSYSMTHSMHPNS